jgi:hypothetical protein
MAHFLPLCKTLRSTLAALGKILKSNIHYLSIEAVGNLSNTTSVAERGNIEFTFFRTHYFCYFAMLHYFCPALHFDLQSHEILESTNTLIASLPRGMVV